MQQRVAVIKKCRDSDLDDRPKSEQRWCLYTHDGKRLLGRHPTEESAERQERKIQMEKHGDVPQAVKYRGATYVLAEPPKEVRYKGAKYVLAADALYLDVNQAAAMFLGMLFKNLEELKGQLAKGTAGKDQSGNEYVVVWKKPLETALSNIDDTVQRLQPFYEQHSK